jgi:hypothetical protein
MEVGRNHWEPLSLPSPLHGEGDGRPGEGKIPIVSVNWYNKHGACGWGVDCGLVDWFLPEKDVRKLKKKFSPEQA